MAEHKYAKILRAIADNSDLKIQFKDPHGNWCDGWLPDLFQYPDGSYRIKPTIVKKWKWVYCIRDCGHEYEEVTPHMTEEKFKRDHRVSEMKWYQKIDATMITMIEVEENV